MHINDRIDRIIERLGLNAEEMLKDDLQFLVNEVRNVYMDGAADAEIDKLVSRQQVRSRMLERAKAAESELKVAVEMLKSMNTRMKQLESMLSLSRSSSSQTSTSPSSPEPEPHQELPPSSNSTK